MPNRTPSEDHGSPQEIRTEPKGRLRNWTKGMRVEMLANLAHELRTPLQVLLGYLDILRDEWADQLPPEARAMLQRMNTNLHDLSQTVDNIMEFVMSEAGATGRVEEDVSISSLVNDLTPAIEAARSDKQVVLKVDTQQAPAAVHTSRRPLRSIVANLVLNAIKFTERGEVTLRISSSHERGGRSGLVVEVADTGLGMSADLIKRAGEPFAQLSQSTARKYRGLGLGLAVVHRNISALGAKLEVTSTPGRGSRFIVRIPSAPLISAQPPGKVSKQIFARSARSKNVPPPDSIKPSASSPRKAASVPANTLIFK
jgi:signal transduction histidine kinase